MAPAIRASPTLAEVRATFSSRIVPRSGRRHWMIVRLAIAAIAILVFRYHVLAWLVAGHNLAWKLTKGAERNHPADVAKLAGHFKDLGVTPEVEVYEPGHIDIAKGLIKKNLLAHPVHYQFVLGIPGGMNGEARSLVFMQESIDPGDSWAVAGIGRYELPLAVHAVVMGGHVRVGLEDNVYYRKGELATGNAQLVERIARIAKEVDREIATPDEARADLGIETRY